jgi:hypothetical protein
VIFFEGEPVRWCGGGGIRAEGHIVSVDSDYAANVKWATGPQAHEITLTDLFDIEKASSKRDDDPMHLVAVRRAYDSEREVGVLNFLASNEYTEGWTKIASDVLHYTRERLRADASMDLVDEQLSTPEQARVVEAAALVLLRDAFSEEDES